MKRLVLLVLIVCLIFSVCFGCSKQEGDSSKLQVVATIGMIADVAKNIAGERAEVVGLMGSGVDPHLYKATANDLSRLTKADLILYNGLHLESKMGEIFEKMGGSVMTVAVAESLPKERLISEGENLYDPHVWFDVEFWIIVTENIYKALLKADPEGKAIFEANYQAYNAKLLELEAFVKSRVAELPEDRRVLITAHDAFNYFGKAYSFQVMGLQGISTVSEAGTQDVQKLATFIAEKKIPAIFVESSVPKKNIEALQAAVKSRGYEVKIGGELFSDAMGDAGTEEGTYLGMVTHNVNTVVDSLK